MKNRVLHRLMAYVCMPLIFTFIAYFLIYLAIPKQLKGMAGLITFFMGEEEPARVEKPLTNIFDNASYLNTEIHKVQMPDVNGGNASELYQFINSADVESPNYGEMYARMSCDRIGLSTDLYWGDSNSILKNGAGQYIGSFIPGYGRPLLICGHNTTCFKPLKDAKVGDVITIQTNYEVYEYEITSIEVLNEKDAYAMMDELLSADEEVLMAYTCFPFEKMTVRKTNRYFVFAKKISGLPLDDVTTFQKLESSTNQLGGDSDEQ